MAWMARDQLAKSLEEEVPAASQAEVTADIGEPAAAPVTGVQVEPNTPATEARTTSVLLQVAFGLLALGASAGLIVAAMRLRPPKPKAPPPRESGIRDSVDNALAKLRLGRDAAGVVEECYRDMVRAFAESSGVDPSPLTPREFARSLESMGLGGTAPRGADVPVRARPLRPAPGRSSGAARSALHDAAPRQPRSGRRNRQAHDEETLVPRARRRSPRPAVPRLRGAGRPDAARRVSLGGHRRPAAGRVVGGPADPRNAHPRGTGLSRSARIGTDSAIRSRRSCPRGPWLRSPKRCAPWTGSRLARSRVLARLIRLASDLAMSQHGGTEESAWEAAQRRLRQRATRVSRAFSTAKALSHLSGPEFTDLVRATLAELERQQEEA